MNQIYSNKTVLITGSSRGIGAATALYFAKNNYNVIVNYLHSEATSLALKDTIEKKYHVKAMVIQCDISNEDEVKKMLEEVTKEFKTIDVLVNNAAISIDTTVEDKTVSNFKKILDTNLIGVFLMCKYFGEYMKNNQGTSIVNIASTNAIDSFYPYSMDYDASKSGVISLTHNFAVHLAPHIRVNAIAPGWVKTDATSELNEEQIKEECSHILLNRFALPNEIAESIYYAATATYLNDSIIKIDGGHK